MLIRYYFELAIGFLVIIAVLFLGAPGNTLFVLFAVLPVIMKKKKKNFDERELYVFYKAGNLTMGLMILCLFLIHHFFDAVINGKVIGDNWFPLSIGAMLTVHGLSGLIMNRTQIT